MGLFNILIQYIAPLFLITSPITSYGDQIRSMHSSRSSQGFSLDTPLIMLVASILRCFYWLGAEFETSLLIQSILMIFVQLTLLKVALDHRPPEVSQPFSMATNTPRPYRFWQWRGQRPYWEFLAYFTLSTAVLQLVFGRSGVWVNVLGYVALGIEALLPLPQVLANQRSRSCQGFRVSVLVSWLVGDAMKMVYFWNAQHVGFQFKACALVQMVFDVYLGVQFWTFGGGPKVDDKGREMPML
ncbi:hypothetical protein BDD12DRAFT_890245 [Trichophaea hybrida]|nr:hypothetical protein BDD12DRAFT_890245 [Trichophaea hybrida]